MSTTTKNPFTSVFNAYCGLIANQVSDMSMQLDKAITQSNRLITELAERGEAVEADLKRVIPGNVTMNMSIKKWFETLNIGRAKTDKQLDELSKKVDGLIDAVAVLAAQKAKVTQTKPAVRKPRTAKPVASKQASTAKKAAAKPAAKSNATRKAPARKPRATKPVEGE